MTLGISIILLQRQTAQKGYKEIKEHLLSQRHQEAGVPAFWIGTLEHITLYKQFSKKKGKKKSSQAPFLLPLKPVGELISIFSFLHMS